MNTKLMALVTVFAIVPALSAAHTASFQPYSLTINNNSGGLLEVKKVRGLTGITNRTDLTDGQSATAMVKRRGGELKVVAGPEHNKTVRTVDIHSKMPGAHRPSVTFTETGVVSAGFSTQDKVYKVTIDNQSGGFAHIIDASDASGKGLHIPPMKSASITVKPNAFILVETGPEKRKVVYKINFADQTGRNPVVVLSKRSFTSNGIRAIDLEVQARRSTQAVHPKLHARVARKNLDTIKATKQTRTNNALMANKTTTVLASKKLSNRSLRRTQK